MKHYIPAEWFKYKQGLINDQEARLMEDHLQHCDSCTEVFLSQISEIDIINAAQIIPDDFSKTTMELIKHKTAARPLAKKNTRRKILSYYVIAATITLMLVNQGAFTAAVNKTSSLPASSWQTEEKLDNFIYTWPSQIREQSYKLSQLMQIKGKNIKEVLK